jgi:hypothetical protein
MQAVRAFLLALLIVGCNSFPTNTIDHEFPVKQVYLEHLSTDYVPIQDCVEGLLATKVNVLSFSVRVKNFQPVALEFYGRLKMEGSPEAQEHSIRFRTDTVDLVPEAAGFTFNTLMALKPETQYTLLRPKFPTNEYAPFQGDQGKVIKVTITEAWAFDESGESFTVELRPQ